MNRIRIIHGQGWVRIELAIANLQTILLICIVSQFAKPDLQLGESINGHNQTSRNTSKQKIFEHFLSINKTIPKKHLFWASKIDSQFVFSFDSHLGAEPSLGSDSKTRRLGPFSENRTRLGLKSSDSKRLASPKILILKSICLKKCKKRAKYCGNITIYKATFIYLSFHAARFFIIAFFFL